MSRQIELPERTATAADLADEHAHFEHALLSRLAEDHPHPPWCAVDHGENNSHAGQYVLIDAYTGIDPATGEPVVSKVGVMVIQGSKRPLVWIARRAYLPEDARAIAGLLCVLGHAVLAAAITRAVTLAEES